jgi:2-polyprenyl-6-methoxyphenol hydroxylase-like FAD-dependent oxidoreductase
MPPQGESTGIAIEDGVLIARILSQHRTKPVEQLFSDFASVRNADIDKHYKAAEKMSKMVSSKPPGVRGLLMDMMTMVWLIIKKRQRADIFKGDVRSIELPV